MTVNPPLGATGADIFCYTSSLTFVGCYVRRADNVAAACASTDTPMAVNCDCWCSSTNTGGDRTAVGVCRTFLDTTVGSATYGLPTTCQTACVNTNHFAFSRVTCSSVSTTP